MTSALKEAAYASLQDLIDLATSENHLVLCYFDFCNAYGTILGGVQSRG